MTGYLLTAGVNARLDTAVAVNGTVPVHGTVATRHTWTAGHEGKSAGYVKIGATTPASPSPRWSVLITGGVHARELAPPDALVAFVERLLSAYARGTGVSYPAFTTDGVTYPAFDVHADIVRAVVERLNLVVAPLVNADGRDYVLAPLPFSAPVAEQELHKNWRKNRRPKPPVFTDERAGGVDINRNFDILFDFEKHYSAAGAATVRTSTNHLHDTFYGGKSSAGSEPETKNLVKLFHDEGIGYYLDVHSYSRKIMWSWGIETNQSDDVAQSFMNAAKDGQRDGTAGNAYREYIPSGQEAAASMMAFLMCNAIATEAGGADPTALRRSTYEAIPSSRLYPTTGTTTDFCFSRWFTEAAAGRPIRPVTSIVIEAGGDPRNGPDHQDGAFWPDYTTQYPKIEREIHAAIWSFLTQIVVTPVTGPSAPPPPSPAPAPSGTPSRLCLVATTLYRDPEHPSVVFLRDVRDRQLLSTGPGRRFATWLTTGYDRVSPGIAAWFTHHPTTARLTRRLVFGPFVATLRTVSAATARSPRARSLVLSAALGTLAGPIIAAGQRQGRRRKLRSLRKLR